MKKICYVQPDVPLELNENIIDCAGAIKNTLTTDNGIKVVFQAGKSTKGFEASSADDLAIFNQTNLSNRMSNIDGEFEETISFVCNDVIKVSINQSNKKDYGMVKPYERDISITHQENSEQLICQNDKYTIKLDKNTGSFSVTNKDGKIRFEEVRNVQSVYWGYFAPPLAHIECRRETYTTQSFKRYSDESYYGFGEQFTDFDKRNQLIDIWNVDPANTLSSPSYKNIPFFMSTRNYGILVNSSRRSMFDMGTKTSEAISIRLQGDGLEYFVILGESMMEILDRYYKLTGEPSMTPLWSFGIWMSSLNKYNSAENMIQIAEEFRKNEFPCDVLHIDPIWMGAKTLVCPFGWGEKFNDYKKMLTILKEKGFKLSLWVAPYIPLSSKHYEDGLEKECYIKDNKGDLIVNKGPMNFWSEPFVYVDFTYPKALEWYKSLIKEIIKDGVSIIKNDLGELGPSEALYFNGMDGAEGHNYYTLEYARATYEACHEELGENAIIWCRSGFIGAQQYPCHWAGDVTCNFENMRGQLRAILSAGMSGFVFFSHDTAGFVGEPTPELYARWYQLGCFTSHMRAHGCVDHEPWNYGQEVEDICRKYSLLRYSLLPTIYSAAKECCEKHYPMIKPLVLEYQNDPVVTNITDEYLFANRFLVCPVFEGECSRKVYLPEGTWFDYYTGIRYEGEKWYDIQCPLSHMPLYVRDNSVIFTCEPKQFISEDAQYENLTATIYTTKQDYNEVIELLMPHGCRERIHIKRENGNVEIESSILLTCKFI